MPHATEAASRDGSLWRTLRSSYETILRRASSLLTWCQNSLDRAKHGKRIKILGLQGQPACSALV